MSETNGRDWDQYFGEKFPDGALAILAAGDPEVAEVDKSPQILITGVGVENHDEDTPTLYLKAYYTGHPIFFTLNTIVSEDPARMVLATDEGRFLVLSNRVSDSQAEMVRARKQGGIFS